MKLLVVAAALAGAASLSACATITRGTSTTWKVESTPGGASVNTSNGFSCQATPCSFRMPRKSEFRATIAKAGYKTVEAFVGNRVTGAGGAGMAGNVIFGGIIGGAVDAGSGAMLDLRPNPLIVTLEAGEGTVSLSQQQAETVSAEALAARSGKTKAKSTGTK